MSANLSAFYTLDIAWLVLTQGLPQQFPAHPLKKLAKLTEVRIQHVRIQFL